ncbi:MAG: 4-hydroxythreonine-4-phosphate dehydrogenase PdxA, partial [Bdellovibrio sp.]
TGPLSKTLIYESGLRDMGHTDILKRVSKTQNVHMGFLGREFNVLLATAHIPLNKIAQSLTTENLSLALINANHLRKILPTSLARKPIGLLGLNPHAGEAGLIGDEEGQLFPSLLSFARQHKIPVSGPLVPDAAFLKSNWKKYSVFLALYHDQGLIPFKLVHGQQSGVHISVGLPFIRTSVDHGTAKDIFEKNKALPHSMRDALTWAVKLSRL